MGGGYFLEYRSAIPKFRTSAHCFPIEYGTWIKIERNNRVCQICFMGGLGSEFQNAKISVIVKVRKEFIDLTQITDKNKIIDKIFKIEDKNYHFYITYLRNIKKNLIA